MSNDLKHATNRLDEFIDSCQNPNDNAHKALMFLVANIDKIKYLASSHPPAERQKAIYNFIKKSFGASRSDLNEKEVYKILNRRKIYSVEFYMLIYCILNILILLFIKLVVLSSITGILNVLIWCGLVIFFILSMSFFNYCLDTYNMKLYRIPKEYKGKFLKSKALDCARF